MRNVLTLTFLTICFASYGQIQDSIKYEGKMFPIEPRIDTFKETLFIISLEQQTIQVNQNDFLKDSINIKPEWIKSINILKGKDAIAQYGDRGKNGVVVIDLKQESLDLLSPQLKGKLTPYKN